MCELTSVYRSLIIEALNSVSSGYYFIETTYEPIVRERAFCYELYHHIRLLQEQRNNTCLSLNGEIDKRGHPEFKKSDWKNPDFVFHVPGTMGKNTIVVEVKGNIEGKYLEGVKKDINTLITFVKKYHYKEGIFLVYNYSFFECRQHLRDLLNDSFTNVADSIRGKIIIITKQSFYADAEVSTLNNLLV